MMPNQSRPTSFLRNGRRSRIASSTTEEEVDVVGPSSSRGSRSAVATRPVRVVPSPASMYTYSILNNAP